jgi:hypothetical protein
MAEFNLHAFGVLVLHLVAIAVSFAYHLMNRRKDEPVVRNYAQLTVSARRVTTAHVYHIMFTIWFMLLLVSGVRCENDDKPLIRSEHHVNVPNDPGQRRTAIVLFIIALLGIATYVGGWCYFWWTVRQQQRRRGTGNSSDNNRNEV